MGLPLLDEDGRCRRTGLLPDQCGCEAHRNSELVQRFDDVTFNAFMDAQYDGQCALVDEHRIQAGTRIGHTEHGWACNRCVQEGKRIGVPTRVL